MSAREQVADMLLDFVKAFDKVPQHILYKLDYYGVRNSMLRLLYKLDYYGVCNSTLRLTSHFSPIGNNPSSYGPHISNKTVADPEGDQGFT